jgi:hypothetical protein
MSYHDTLNYLAHKTSIVELYDQWGGRVAVCPEWSGRILTSTCEGLEGDSFGGINVQAIADGLGDFGGEDHWTLFPLGHSFVIETIKESKAVLQRTLQTTDANGTPAEFHLTRSIALLSRRSMGQLFGDAVSTVLEQDNVSVIGFHTENTVRAQEKACIVSRQRGMFNATPHTFVILSTPPPEQPVLEMFTEANDFHAEVDYLGGSPHGRIRHLPRGLLIRADGHGQCQTTLPFSAAPPILGAIELRFGTITLWTFDLPDNSTENDAVNDMVRIYNHGRSRTSEPDWATYYEINCFSAARLLQPECSFTYCQSTLHLSADNDVLGDLIQQIFGVSLGAFPKDVR